MFIALLKFSGNKSRAGQFMEGHKEWIQRGLDDGVFLLVGSLHPKKTVETIQPTRMIGKKSCWLQ